MTIIKEEDLSKFKNIKGNRPVRRGHVNKLKRNILKSNCLHLKPIIVNEEMEVLDGQGLY